MISNDNLNPSHPEWAGLILIGGKSSRMNVDKSTLIYKGKAHREYIADLLFGFTHHVIFSFCPDTQAPIYPKVELIPDHLKDSGPLGGDS